jgi:hypothetical protein
MKTKLKLSKLYFTPAYSNQIAEEVINHLRDIPALKDNFNFKLINNDELLTIEITIKNINISIFNIYELGQLVVYAENSALNIHT